MLDDDDFLEQFERKTWGQRLVIPVVGVILVAGAGAVGYELIGNHSPAPRPHMEPRITQVQLPPPPPPPPPPKQIPPPKKEPEQTRSREPTPTKPQQVAQPKAPLAPPNRVQTSVQGNGPSSLGAGNGGGGDCIGASCGNGNGPGGGGEDAYYASLVKSQVMSALNHDEKLRFARYSTTCSLRFDAAGHVASASCSGFSGDQDVRGEVNRVVHAVTAAGGASESLASKEFSVHINERAPG